MKRIAVLTDNSGIGRQLMDWINAFCMKKGIFPIVEMHEDCELFFSTVKEYDTCGVIIAMNGVAGLNAAEHMHSLCPDCGLIWCSDLDFSLHAYRLRAQYFIQTPLTEQEIGEGMMRWAECGRLQQMI